MNISIDFRHPWSISDKVAHIERTDLNGKQARRVLAAITEEQSRLGLDLPRALDLESVWDRLVDYKLPFPAWPDTEADDEENGRNWKALDKVYRTLTAEAYELDRLRRYYERRTYRVKELDDLTREEWQEILPWELDMLNEFQRAKYGV